MRTSIESLYEYMNEIKHQSYILKNETLLMNLAAIIREADIAIRGTPEHKNVTNVALLLGESSQKIALGVAEALLQDVLYVIKDIKNKRVAEPTTVSEWAQAIKREYILNVRAVDALIDQ